MNSMMQLFLMALGLVFVFEGILPFLVPHVWRRAMQQMMTQPDKTLRIMGFVSMLIGLSILYLGH